MAIGNVQKRNKYEQHGRQPSLRQLQPSLETKAKKENVLSSTKKKGICRNFIWGHCYRDTKCWYRHELDISEMKKILKFCHDYQNKCGCTRDRCTYLHTTMEEEKRFFATGQIPRVLAERHAILSDSEAETIQKIAMFIQQSFIGAPPPPPAPDPMVAPLIKTSTLIDLLFL